jgi:hypothetical protein
MDPVRLCFAVLKGGLWSPGRLPAGNPRLSQFRLSQERILPGAEQDEFAPFSEGHIGPQNGAELRVE